MISNKDITVQDLFVHVENWFFLKDINYNVFILKSFVSNKFTEEQLEEFYPEGWLIYFKWNHFVKEWIFLNLLLHNIGISITDISIIVYLYWFQKLIILLQMYCLKMTLSEDQNCCTCVI